MMKKNNRLYQHLIILLALGNSSFALAEDNEVAKKNQAAMPAAPSGPYRSWAAHSPAYWRYSFLSPQY